MSSVRSDDVLRSIVDAKDLKVLMFEDGDRPIGSGMVKIVSANLPTFEIPSETDDEIASRIITKLMERKPNTPQRLDGQ